MRELLRTVANASSFEINHLARNAVRRGSPKSGLSLIPVYPSVYPLARLAGPASDRQRSSLLVPQAKRRRKLPLRLVGRTTGRRTVSIIQPGPGNGISRPDAAVRMRGVICQEAVGRRLGAAMRPFVKDCPTPALRPTFIAALSRARAGVRQPLTAVAS